MVLIVDNSAKKRGRELRSCFLKAGIPCALVNMETLKRTAPARFTIAYAENENQLSIVSLRAGATDYIVINDTGRRMFNHDAHMYDPDTDGDIVGYVSKRADELFGINTTDPAIPPIRFDGEYTLFRNRYIRLTATEKMIVRHLIMSNDDWHSAEEIVRYAYNEPSLRARKTVSSHVSSINRKAQTATGEKLIVAHRGLGYRILLSASKGRKYGHYDLTPEKPLFV